MTDTERMLAEQVLSDCESHGVKFHLDGPWLVIRNSKAMTRMEYVRVKKFSQFMFEIVFERENMKSFPA